MSTVEPPPPPPPAAELLLELLLFELLPQAVTAASDPTIRHALIAFPNLINVLLW
ncbi:MAG TPA: hypothetical protein VHW04_22280 [Solirubrobacteraceae bacterium]|jgi:hypothetical protein|nr:hypothetical protein [Solirubrobacteraceae bacterium]